jgi:hypothetical protein
MASTRSRRVALAVGATGAVYASAALAYVVNDNWCDRESLGWAFRDADWSQRGISPGDMEHEVKLAASWWWDAQATLGFGEREGWDIGWIAPADPGPISGLCQNEWQHFIDNPGVNASTVVTEYWHPACDTFGQNNDLWHIVVRTDRDGAGCGSAVNWAFNKNDQLAGKIKPMYRVVAHEFGHALGLGHSSNPQSLMTGGGVTWDHRLSVDDKDGVVNGLGEGLKGRSIQTAAAPNATNPFELAFKAVNTVSNTSSALWMPAAAGNKAAFSGGTHSSWEFAFAWVDTQYKIHVATGNDGATYDDNISITRNTTTSFTTRAAPAIAVSPQGLIGIAWTTKATGEDRSAVHFAVSSDDGLTWSDKDFEGLGFFAIGGASLTFSPIQNRWILAWVQDRADSSAINIAQIVSVTGTGLSWNTTALDLGPTFSMPTKQPAFTCMREDSSACVMAIMSYWWGDRPLMTAGGPVSTSGFQPLTDPIDLGTFTYGYSNIALAHGSGGYVMTYTNGLASSPMMYSRLGDSTGESGQFNSPSQWTNGPTSRSGFAIMWNYKKGRYRLFWRND